MIRRYPQGIILQMKEGDTQTSNDVTDFLFIFWINLTNYFFKPLLPPSIIGPAGS